MSEADLRIKYDTTIRSVYNIIPTAHTFIRRLWVDRLFT